MASSLKTILLLAAAALFYLQAVNAQDSDTTCSQLRSEFRRKDIPLFRNPTASDPDNLIKHTCFRRNRLREFYSCPENTAASILDQTGTVPDLRRVYDLRSIVLSCDDNVVATSTLVASTEPPTEEELPTLSSCPSAPTRLTDYSSEENLCLYQCSFGIAYAGITIGRRTRTVTRCCNGEPRLSRRAPRKYTCAPQETISSTKAPESPLSSSEVPVTSSEAPKIQSSSISIIPASSSEAPGITVPTSAPTGFTPCPSSGPTRQNNYVRSIRDDPNKVCKSQCSFGTAVDGQPSGRRTREIYRCCNGEAKLISRPLNLYNCPEI